jgi:hypothetical protein
LAKGLTEMLLINPNSIWSVRLSENALQWIKQLEKGFEIGAFNIFREFDGV